MAAKHTPTPWAVEDPLGPEILSIVAGGPQVYDWVHIAQISATGDRDEGDAPISQAKANAALIVRAVNAHDDLVEAVRAGILCLEATVKTMRGYPIEEHYKRQLIQARAALTKAEA